MAYKNTYEDLLEDIRASGQNWSSADLDLARNNPDAGRGIYNQKQAWESAQTDAERQAAHDAAEMIRKQYGNYSAGGDGSGYSAGRYEKAPAYTEYESKYKDKIDSLMAQISAREDFSYTPTDDPAYAAYAEHYRNAGEQARKDTLARAAAMTGGMPSTYAVAAAQQAQNDYNAQMSNVIPQLRDAAYSMYMNDQNALRSDLDTLLGLDEMEYARHQNAYQNAFNKWQADYAVGRDMIEDEMAAAALAARGVGSGGGTPDKPKYKFDKNDYAEKTFKRDTDSFKSFRDRLMTGTKSNVQMLQMIEAAVDGNTISEDQARQLMKELGLL